MSRGVASLLAIISNSFRFDFTIFSRVSALGVCSTVRFVPASCYAGLEILIVRLSDDKLLADCMCHPFLGKCSRGALSLKEH